MTHEPNAWERAARFHEWDKGTAMDERAQICAEGSWWAARKNPMLASRICYVNGAFERTIEEAGRDE